MAQHCPHCVDLDSRLNHRCGERMPQIVEVQPIHPDLSASLAELVMQLEPRRPDVPQAGIELRVNRHNARVAVLCLAQHKRSSDNLIFPNDASIVRLVGAMMLEQNDEWSLNRRYMQLEGLQTLCDTVPTRLPAVAR